MVFFLVYFTPPQEKPQKIPNGKKIIYPFRRFEDKKKAIIAGKFHPFQGPIVDQSGAVKVAAGSIMPLGELLSLNYYVKGVEGSVPK